MTDKSYVVYIGGYLDEKIVRERGLPARNPAGSNRMQRIADALQSVGQSVVIVSPGTCLRLKFVKKVLHPIKKSHTRATPVLFCPTIGIPILSALSSYYFLPLILYGLFKKKYVSAVIIYNSSPLLVMICLWLKWIEQVPVFQNIEDVCIPKLQDWIPGKEVNPVQQVIFYPCMKVIAKLSKGLIVPSKRFLEYVVLKPSLVVTGCINVNNSLDVEMSQNNNVLNLLFAGKIENEHGIDVFINTLITIDREDDFCNRLEVDICGTGTKADRLTDICAEMDNLKINYHGFVSDTSYQRLLNKSDICVALQDPEGRYAANKTPSKVYEYLGNAKTVIATDVGDLSELPDDIITICTPFNESELYKKICFFAENPELAGQQARLAGIYAKEHYVYNKVGQKVCEFLEKHS